MNLTALLSAIAIIESADARHPQGNDLARGKRGEVSRYQIMPATWKAFGGGALVNARNPAKARVVAVRIINFNPPSVLYGLDDSIRIYAMRWNPTWLRSKYTWDKLHYCDLHPNCYPNRVLREYQAIVRR